MNQRAQMQLLPDGKKLHLNDGPIDIIAEAFGRPGEIEIAYAAARARFVTVLDELCAELTLLRQPCRPDSIWPTGTTARRMMAATLPYAAEFFITPMAAVAGAVAEEIMSAMVRSADIACAYVNDGGDIALHITPGQKFVIGMVERPDQPEHPSLFGTTTLSSTDTVRGIATSGWHGRSFSLGIADAVTVLADHAAAADAAATIIANAVDLPGHQKITRVRACELDPNTDLAARLVTREVGELSAPEITSALEKGAETAVKLLRIGLIRAAALHLQGETRVVGLTEATTSISKSTRERGLMYA